MLLTALAACSKGTQNGGTATDPTGTVGTGGAGVGGDQVGVGEDDIGEQETKVPLVPLPDANYNGYMFSFYMQDGEMLDDVLAKEDSNSTVKKTVYARNKKIENAYNVDIEVVRIPNNDSGSVAIGMIQSGAFDYDVIAAHSRYASAFLTNGVLYDWGKLPNLNITYDWWNQSARKAWTINNKTFYMTGDISHMATACSYVLLANKTRIEDKGLTVPYQDVKDGTWNWEKFKKLTLDCTDDNNGDSEWTLGTDAMGYLTMSWAGPFGAFYQSGSRGLEYDANGAPYISVGTETAYNALSEFFDFVALPQNHLNMDGAMSNGDYQSVINGNFVFADYTLAYIEMKFGDLDYEYAILPYPHMNENVKEYTAHTAGSINAFLIPSIAEDPTRTAVILEALCQEGSKSVIPVYFDNVISLQTMDTVENYDMLQIIKKGQLYDAGYFIMGYVGSCPAYFGSKGNCDDFYSYIQSQEAKSLGVLQDLMAAASN